MFGSKFFLIFPQRQPVPSSRVAPEHEDPCQKASQSQDKKEEL
jgi:hypothetical protein